jgi:hypothetical protein
MARSLFATGLLFVLLVLTLTPRVCAQWQANGIAVADVTDDEMNCRMVSDGAGGVIVVWRDHYAYSDNPDIYAQRIDADGNLLWSGYGCAVCTASGGQYEPRIVSDGAGGAIIAWCDFRYTTGHIRAQRVDAAGNCLWAPNGLVVSAATNTWGWSKDFDLRMIPSADGAILSWSDNRTGDWNIYAQQLALNGTCLWTPNGITVCGASGTQQGSRIAPDGEGGAIIAWCSTTSDEGDIYAQRVASDGTLQWTPGGTSICAAYGSQGTINIISDNNGGAFVAWMDSRSDTFDIYVQSVGAEGNVMWQTDGKPVCTAVNQQWNPVLAADLVGGVYATWYDRRNAAAALSAGDVSASGELGWHDGGTYAQHLDAIGNALWAQNGSMIRDDPSLDDQTQAIIPDGYNGAIIGWVAQCPPVAADAADAAGEGSAPGAAVAAGAPNTHGLLDESVGAFVQRVSYDGTCVWGEGGISLTGDESLYPVMISDGGAGAIVAWIQWPCAFGGHGIYAQRVSGNGIAPPTASDVLPAATLLTQNYPNPFNPSTRIAFTLKESAYVSLRIYDLLGRLVCVIREGWCDAGSHVESWNGMALDGTHAASGVYFCRLDTGAVTQERKMILLR